ncbi:caspase family protein [Neorhizobium tomejilense]|uniref:caspase family protein n=1 Tax=Neorhizobium tomejilense TaxID=2093828 RepID=UPI000CF9AD3C|nr:caspase family protein [Neorhizobium tomejilense]
MKRGAWIGSGLWTYALIGLAFALAAPDALPADNIREIKRKLWVLGELSGTNLDGEEDRGYRDSLARFASTRNLRVSNDDEAASLLDRAIDEKTRQVAGPYDDPLPFDRPSFSGDWVAKLVIDAEDNVVLAGSCSNIARFRLDTGLPAKSFPGAPGLNFTYSSSMDEIICLAAWDDKAQGLVVIDAITGMLEDFILLPGMDSFSLGHLEVDGTGTAVWVFGTNGLWAVDLVTREARRVVSKLPDNLPQNIAVSDDGSLVAIEFTYGMKSGKKGFPKEIRTYDATTGRQLSAVFDVEGLTLAPQGDRYLAEKEDVYQVLDARTGKRLFSKKFEGINPEEGMVFTSDGSGVLLAHYDDEETRSILRWDFASGGVTTISHIGQTGKHVRFDEQRGEAYTVGSDGVFRYRLQTGEALTPPRAVDRIEFVAAAVSPDGKTAVGIGLDSAYVLDTESGQVRHLTISGCTIGSSVDLSNSTSPVSFSNNRRLALGCEDGSIKDMDIETGVVFPVGNFSDDGPAHLVTSPDGFYLAAIYSDHSDGKSEYTLIVAERSTGRVILRRKTAERLSGLGFADAGRRVLYGEGHFAVVIDIDSGKRVAGQELKLEMTKSGRTTRWYWGSVGWVIPDSETGDDTLFSATGTGGLVYSYAQGKFSLRAGNLWASNDSVAGFARWGRVKALADQKLVTVQGAGGPAIGRLGADQWASRHAPVGGEVLALGAQNKGRFVVVTDIGGILLYDPKRAAPIMTTVLSENGNWLSRIDGGYFAGTRGAAENLFLAPSVHETITVDSLFDTLYRPDLVVNAASGVAPDRQADPGEGIKTLLKDGLPPTVAIVSPSNNGTADDERIVAKANIIPSTGGVGRIEWRVNGIVRVARNLTSGAAVRQGEPIAVEDRLLLEPGNNLVELSVFNAANGIASIPATINVNWGDPASSAPPRLFVLAVGINRYWDSRLSLNFATDDASEIVRGFKLAGGDLFDDVKSWLITNEQATREGIGLAFDDIARSIRSTDVFVLFVAGHGKTLDGRYFFLPHDFKYSGEASIAAQGIGQDHWQAWMTRVATRKSLLMFDTCESGTLTQERTTRGFDRLAALDRLTRATGRSILAASSDDGPALEGFQGHGIFAYSVLEGLGVADSNRTGLIQVTALASHVGARVPDLSYGKFGIRQVPQMKLIGEDFAIGKAVSALSAVADDFVPAQPTHVVVSLAPLTDAKASATGETLAPGALLRVVFEAGGRSEVARAGKRIGFVPTTSLAPMH